MIVVHTQLLPKKALTVCTWVVLIASKGGCVGVVDEKVIKEGVHMGACQTNFEAV